MSVSIKLGTRNSRLAQIQTERAVRLLETTVPACSFEAVTGSSPGDRDRDMDLRVSPSDFFTRDLDEAVLSGKLDAAMHSAKDVPDPVSEGLDWVWLPWAEDPRDVLMLAAARAIPDLPATPRVGVSSARREAYAEQRFPGAQMVSIRGNMEARLEQLDAGACDVLIMAAAALIRLGLESRITEWIPLAELPTPDGQGSLAVTFRTDDERLVRLRSLLVRPVTFMGAGVGSADLCTLAGIKALGRCDVCLYDSLFDATLLEHVSPHAERIDVGKRCGEHPVKQQAINEMLTRYARRGLRVVRVKGGDPGIFGRLAEEVACLDARRLPYRVIPGVSSLSAATTGTGMLLTRRDVSPGFSVMTARAKGGALSTVSGNARAALPCVFFMGLRVVAEIVDQLMADGMDSDTPAAVVFNAGSEQQQVVRAALADIANATAVDAAAPGLLVVGDVAAYGFEETHGALRGMRVLLTCSEALMERAVAAVRDFGGRPVPFSLIRLEPELSVLPSFAALPDYDWLVLPSPSAVRCLLPLLAQCGIDVRQLPRIMVSGPATAAELAQYGLEAEVCPARNYGARGVLEAVQGLLEEGARVLRLRSDRAGPELAEGLRSAGAEVDDVVVYRNMPISRDDLPDFDAAVFASGSAVQVFQEKWGAEVLSGKITVAMGPPTEMAFVKHGLPLDVTAPEATIEGVVSVLARYLVNTAIEEMST